jgi:hypothetical protein
MTDTDTTTTRVVPAAGQDVRVRPAAARRGRVIGLSVLVGVAIAVLWSAKLADDDIGLNTANGLLGQQAADATITGTVAGLIFAFVTGLAGTFTACNVAVFSAIAPMVENRSTLGGRIVSALRPMGWLALGAALVAGTYGAIGALVGTRLPQLSTAVVDGHVPVKTLQSITVFGVIGLVMIYLGLAAAKIVPDPLAALTSRWAPAPQLLMGLLIGGFLIGRPWPLFHKMFLHAASTHDALFGAATFVLVVIGNMLVMGVLFLLLSLSPFPRWLRARPSRIATVTAAALLVGGTFTFVYWGVRVPAGLGFGWFPTMPWH